ncbi:MAG: nucleotide pyrophosphatase, partial [Thermoplasmata archaeon]
MLLDPKKNYIVSGIERSGTSLLMQILSNGCIPVSSDDKRKADINNPKGYFELEGGKIINKLMEKTFPFEQYKGRFIKITAYGLKFLPEGKHTIIYIERDIEEILDSMEKMAQISDENRNETRDIFLKLNTMIKKEIDNRPDIKVLYINYNKILLNPQEEIKKITDFLEIIEINLQEMINTVDKTLYRQRNIKNA